MDWIKIKSSLNYDDLNKSGLASSFIDDLKSLANSDLSDEEFVTLLDRYYAVDIGSFILEMLEKGKLFQGIHHREIQYTTNEIMAYRAISYSTISVAYFSFKVIGQINERSHSIDELESSIKSRRAIVTCTGHEKRKIPGDFFLDDSRHLTFTNTRLGYHVAHRYGSRDDQIAKLNIENLTIKDLGLYGPWILPLLRNEFATRDLNRDILDLIGVIQSKIEIQRQNVQYQIANLQSQLDILETYSTSLKSETEKLQPDKKATERGSLLLSPKIDSRHMVHE
ncbi:MAG TPA: hypothetical protein DCY94_00915 [Firmicutes bacterium]|nr:hypothetical protein [Bacillota bacterium]